MPSNPKVSVVMSVYNGARYLREAINSILNQTFQDFEFIIINDGSTDSSKDIIVSYKDPRIQLIDNEANLGLPTSLNKGIQAARGQHIARQDADDISLPNRLETQLAHLTAHPEVALVGCWWEYIDLDGDTFDLGQIPNCDEKIKSLLANETVKFPHGSIVMRRDAVIDVGGYDERFWFTQDLDLWLRMSKKFKFASVGKSLYKLRLLPRPTDFKEQYQAQYRGAAYQQFFSGQSVQVPDLRNNSEIKSLHQHPSTSVTARYWYSVGMRAINNGYLREAGKCLLRSACTGDIWTSLKFARRVLLSTFKNNIRPKAI